MSDALAAWLCVRSTTAWPVAAARPGPWASVRDGHRHFLDHVVRPRDPTRAIRLHAALDQVRADARAGAAISFERLSRWHRLAMDTTSSDFRRTPAFAKRGREMYGVDDNTEQRFAECLAEANPERESLIARAARVYLDVLFFHPFSDGNARVAALALDFVLARGGVILDQVGPVFLVSRRADDAAGVAAFVAVLDLLVHASRRRGEYDQLRR